MTHRLNTSLNPVFPELFLVPCQNNLWSIEGVDYKCVLATSSKKPIMPFLSHPFSFHITLALWQVPSQHPQISEHLSVRHSPFSFTSISLSQLRCSIHTGHQETEKSARDSIFIRPQQIPLVWPRLTGRALPAVGNGPHSSINASVDCRGLVIPSLRHPAIPYICYVPKPEHKANSADQDRPIELNAFTHMLPNDTLLPGRQFSWQSKTIQIMGGI